MEKMEKIDGSYFVPIHVFSVFALDYANLLLRLCFPSVIVYSNSKMYVHLFIFLFFLGFSVS